jgi:predicted dehydrogenase
MNIAIVGFGYWGPNLVRNFKNIENCCVTHIAESQKDRHKKINELHPEIEIQSFEEIINNSNIDAIVIATSISSHYNLAKLALEKEKHVLIEKPMADSLEHAEKLIKLSKEKNKILMIDHTYLYSPYIQKIKKIIDEDSIGKVLHVDSIRANWGKFQSDYNVLWDLAPHDLSIINYLLNEMPISVQAIGKSFTNNKLENFAHLILRYKSNKIIHINNSWVSPIKIRTMIFGGSKKMLVFDELQSKKILVYNKNLENISDSFDSTNKELSDEPQSIEPESSSKEPLLMMAQDFVNSIENKNEPLSNGIIGMDVVKILSASQQSIKNSGQEIFI